jgi:hypothetical protein
MATGGHFINGYCGYWRLLINIILVAISGYFINGYWLLFRCKLLVVILLVVIDGYFINGYCIIS